MFSYKNKKKLETNSNQANNKKKINFNLNNISSLDDKFKNKIKYSIENSKSFIDYKDKIDIKRNDISNNTFKINTKKNNLKNGKNIKQNIEKYSKIKYSNNSSDLLNKSILTTSNSENKYGKKSFISSMNYTQSNFLITQINDKLNNNKDKFENDFRINTEREKELNFNDNLFIEYENENKKLNFKQKEKLKKLKYLIFCFDRKQKTIGQNNNILINLERGQNINFCREKKLNKYIPTITYDKNNKYFNKNINLKNFRNNDNSKNKKKIHRNQISNSLELKTFNSKHKNKNSKNNKYSYQTPRNTNNEKETRIKLISKYNLNNIFITQNNNSISNSNKNNNNLYKRNNSSIYNNYQYNGLTNQKDYFKIYKKRCRTSYKPNKYTIFNISKIIKEEYSKALFPLTKRLITKSNIINSEISKEKKNDKLFDYFGENDMKQINVYKKKPIDLRKIRNDINLYNINSHLNETNIVYKGIKRIEKLLTSKREINLARSVAQKVINDDILINNYFDFDATYNIRLQRLIERRLYNKFAGDTVLSKNNMKIKKKPKTDRDRLFKILKGGLDNYFDKKSLEHLIFKYKVIKLKGGKKM